MQVSPLAGLETQRVEVVSTLGAVVRSLVEVVDSVVQDPASFVVVPASLVLSAGDTRRVPHLPPAIEMT